MNSPIDSWNSTQGRALSLRRGRLDDVGRLLDFERHLSPGTKYFRFGRFRDLQFAPEQLQQILDPKNESNVHLVVTTIEDSEEKLLATGRLIIATPATDCQLLIVVRDDWQGGGLGARLTTALCAEARLRGIPVIYCQVMPTNRRMQSFMHKCGFRQVPNPEHDLFVRFEKRLDSNPSRPD